MANLAQDIAKILKKQTLLKEPLQTLTWVSWSSCFPKTRNQIRPDFFTGPHITLMFTATSKKD